jgi:hypothetical protein
MDLYSYCLEGANAVFFFMAPPVARPSEDAIIIISGPNGACTLPGWDLV